MIFRDLTNRLSVRTIDTGALIAVVWTMGVISTIIFRDHGCPPPGPVMPWVFRTPCMMMMGRFEHGFRLSDNNYNTLYYYW